MTCAEGTNLYYTDARADARVAAAASNYATAAQGTQADTNDTDIDDLYTALNAIGNDASITNMTSTQEPLPLSLITNEANLLLKQN